MVEVAAADSRRPGHVRQARILAAIIEPGHVPLRKLAERGPGLGREGQETGPATAEALRRQRDTGHRRRQRHRHDLRRARCPVLPAEFITGVAMLLHHIGGRSSRISRSSSPLPAAAPRVIARPVQCGTWSEVTFRGSRSQSTLGVGSWKCRCLGITPRFTTSAALISPAMPAADSRWPMLVLTEPMSSGWPGRRSAAKTLATASISIGSPTAVPVPCASR